MKISLFYQFLLLLIISSGLTACLTSPSLSPTPQKAIGHYSPVNNANQENPLPVIPGMDEKHKAQEKLKSGDIHVPFIPNHGQLDENVRYYARTFGGTLFVTGMGELVYALPHSYSPAPRESIESFRQQNMMIFSEKLGDGMLNTITPTQPAATSVSIFHGDDPRQWQHDLPGYPEISLGQVYPGVEVRLAAHGNSIEKLFYVAAEADPQNIKIKISSTAKLSITNSGQLDIYTEKGNVLFSRPIAWQDIQGTRKSVEVAYAVNSSNIPAYGFELGQYDHRYPLVIDPLLQSTYLGGSSNDEGLDIAVGPDGNIYVAGITSSNDFPRCTYGPCAPTGDNIFAGTSEAFIAKMSPDLKTLIQTTYLGGNGSEWAEALVIDGTGNIYVTGSTDSSDFPGIAGGADSTLNNRDGFVAKLSSNLRTLAQSTFIGGSSSEFPRDIVISKRNEIIIGGTTLSTNLPSCTAAALPCFPPVQPDPDYGGAREGFAALLNLNLTTMITTYLGGSGSDDIYGLAVAADGNSIYLCGTTNSNDFPFISGGVDTIQQDYEAFVTKLSDTLVGNNAEQSTYYGGSGYEECYDIAVGVDGQVLITGETSSADLPHCSGMGCPARGDATIDSSGDAYVAKLSPNLQTLYGSTYLGGTGFDMATDIAVFPAPWNAWESMVYVTGDTAANDFPKISNGADRAFAGNSEGFVAYLNNSLSTLHQASYLGGNSTDYPYALAVSSTGDIYVTGETRSSDFPGSTQGFDNMLNGTKDAFVTRFSDLKSNGTFYTIPLKNGKAAVIHLD